METRKRVDPSTFFFRPRLVECLRDYNLGKFLADLGAGMTVGIVALPLAMAFGIASGVKPEAGISTAIVAGFIISAFGGFILHALVLLIIILVAAPLAKHIPLSTLSAVLVVVAFNMGEWHEFKMLSRYPKSDATVFLVTF